jgi:hypothetical protein
MITIHHLNFSRSTRIIWLMENWESLTRLFPTQSQHILLAADARPHSPARQGAGH